MTSERAPSSPSFGTIPPDRFGLFTDLYELTMAQGYLAADHTPLATFDLFVRDLPPNRGYLIATGLEQVIAYLEAIEFGPEAIDYLRDAGFETEFLDWLRTFEFTGDLRALPEGTAVFPNEPILEITAPIPQAQLFETMVINQIGYQSLVATKAARMRDVVERKGGDQSLVDFGARRAHGTDAGLKLGRAAYIGGFDGTSNTLTGEQFGVPTYGTMAHSWIQSFDTEREAFEAFIDQYGEDAILLVDTYDTLDGVDLAIDVAKDRNVEIAGVRLDSGDLVELSKRAAPRLPEEVGVFVSSGMDEYAIDAFLDGGGVATGFGPGTALATSADAPKLELVYKLVEIERDGSLEPTMKLSAGKETYPGQKSVVRHEGPDGYERDVLDRREESPSEDLLVEVYHEGDLVYDLPTLDEIRARARADVAALPEPVRRIEEPAPYPVEIGDALESTVDRVRAELTGPS